MSGRFSVFEVPVLSRGFTVYRLTHSIPLEVLQFAG
jgi:hypothetical protein